MDSCAGTHELFQNQETIPKQVFAVASFGTEVRKLGNCEWKLVARLATVSESAVFTGIMGPRWQNWQTCLRSPRSLPCAVLYNVRDDMARQFTFFGVGSSSASFQSRLTVGVVFFRATAHDTKFWRIEREEPAMLIKGLSQSKGTLR